MQLHYKRQSSSNKYRTHSSDLRNKGLSSRWAHSGSQDLCALSTVSQKLETLNNCKWLEQQSQKIHSAPPRGSLRASALNLREAECSTATHLQAAHQDFSFTPGHTHPCSSAGDHTTPRRRAQQEPTRLDGFRHRSGSSCALSFSFLLYTQLRGGDVQGKEALTLDAAQSIQPLAHGSTLMRTSPSTRSGWLSCQDRARAHSEGASAHTLGSSRCRPSGKLLLCQASSGLFRACLKAE